MSGDRKKKIAFNYFGSKFTWVNHILPYFPQPISKIPHFVDMFTGSMSILLNKPYSKIDTGNDINGDVVNFFRCLREDPGKLITLLKLTPVSRLEYNLCWTRSDEPFEQARRFFVRSRQSFGGSGNQRFGAGFHIDIKTSRSNYAGVISKWHNGIDGLWNIIDKLTHIQIEHRDFRDLFPLVDDNEHVIYLDPPYLQECRNSTNDYLHEFTLKDHEDLADFARSAKSKVIISHYACETMDRLYGDWFMVKLPVKKNNIRNGAVQECLWMNYSPTTINQQLFN